MKLLPDSAESAFVYFADSDTKVLLVWSHNPSGSDNYYTFVFMDSSNGDAIGAFHQ